MAARVRLRRDVAADRQAVSTRPGSPPSDSGALRGGREDAPESELPGGPAESGGGAGDWEPDMRDQPPPLRESGPQADEHPEGALPGSAAGGVELPDRERTLPIAPAVTGHILTRFEICT